MGILKLNKKNANNETQQVKSAEMSSDKKIDEGIKEQGATNMEIENNELCELAKQDGGFVEEFKSLRTTNETVYRRNDRTCRKIITATPTRYKDTNGEIKNIRNRLIDNGKEIINEDNSFKVKFSKNAHSGKIFDLQKGSKCLTLSAVGSAKSRSHACDCKCELCADSENIVSATLNDGTEIQYVTLNDRIKENIIVKERQENYEYNFTLNIGDLTVEEGKNNDLLLKDASTGETEFVIPAPYMYDANKKYSNKVSYEIDVIDTELQIKVVADADFINAADRKLPVTIDPQVVISGKDNGFTIWSTLTTEEGDDETMPDILEVHDFSYEYSRGNVQYKIPKDAYKGVLLSAKLVLTCEEGQGSISVGNNQVGYKTIHPTNDDYIDVELDITKFPSGTIRITAIGEDSIGNFITRGDYAPRMVIKFIGTSIYYGDTVYDNDNLPLIKEIKLTDKTTGNLFIKKGGIVNSFTSFETSDFVLPVNISHFYKIANEDNGFGTNWNINLNKKLNVATSDNAQTTKFIYTDEIGDKYLLNEKYYYLKNAKKVFVNKNDVTIDIDGNLSYNNYPVYIYQECCGYTLVPKIDDFKNSELIEQRQNEQIQLENYINQYAPTLKNYVKVKSSNGEIQARLSSLTKDQFESLVNGLTASSTSILITESEALQLQSLIKNISQLNAQKTQLQLQQRQLELQNTQLKNQLASIANTKFVSEKGAGTSSENFSWNFDNNDDVAKLQYKASYADAIRNEELIDSKSSDSQLKLLTDQKTYVANQITSVSEQIEIIKAQKNSLISQAKDNLSLVKEIFLSYFNKKAQLDILLAQTPVNYLKDNNGLINGFNGDGDLVLLCDSYGNYVGITYNSDKQIENIYDSNNKTMRFEYSNKLLQSITDSRGRTVKYSYSGSKLIRVDFPDESWLEFEYQSDSIRSIQTSDNIQAKFSLDDDYRLSTIAIKSMPITIGKTVTFENNSFSKTISQMDIAYSNNSTTLMYGNGEKETYYFDSGETLISYEKIGNNLLSTKTSYTYSDVNGKTVTAVTTKNGDAYETVIERYNEIKQLISKESDWVDVSDTVKTRTLIDYSYDINNNLIEEITTTQFLANDEITKKVHHKKYSYNAQGRLILAESYYDEELLTTGINYAETVYNDNGNVIKTIAWNSLDSSSKFYSEKVYSENGQVVAEKAETGEASAEYEYVNGTNIVNTVKYSNGSKLAYGRNPKNFKVTDISQSTDTGEENSTHILYEHNLPVEVKSGNTVINYTYDYTRKNKKVEINGVAQVSNTYNDNYKYNCDDETAFICSQTTTIFVDDDTITVEATKYGELDDESGKLLVEEETTINGKRANLKNYDCEGRLAEEYNYLLSDEMNLLSKQGNERIHYYTAYSYDDFDNVINIDSQANWSNSDYSVNEQYDYNEFGLLTTRTLTATCVHEYSYFYKDNAAHDLNYISFGEYKFKPLMDVNGRNTGKEVYNGENKIVGEYISYRKVGDHATSMPSTIWFASGTNIKDNIRYKYDDCGNICEITENGHIVTKYKYDALNRLIREDNKLLNKTTVYSYDTNGNITCRCEYEYTTKDGEEISELECIHFEYEYDGDKLLSFNGEKCEYNSLGNPTKYRDKEVVWRYGKLFSAYDGNKFIYDSRGRRIRKNDTQHIYDDAGNLLSTVSELQFVYDNSGVIGFIHNETQYFYRKDVQGNIIAILDNTGAVVVKYIYDAWGNHAVVDKDGKNIEDPEHIGNKNPFRYRGYYYDVETGLYYLQTRYYDPETGRFISQDSIEYAESTTVNGLNLYSYCGNNPVMNVDPRGTSYHLTTSDVINIFAALVEIGVGGGIAIVGWAYKTGVRPNNIGIGTFNKFRAEKLGKLAKGANALSKISTAIAVIAVIVSVVDGIIYDVNRGYDTGRVISNAVTNVVIYGGIALAAGELGAYIGGLVGTVVPGAGNAVGAAVGFALGFVLGLILEIEVDGKSIIDHIRDAFYDFWKWLFGG